MPSDWASLNSSSLLQAWIVMDKDSILPVSASSLIFAANCSAATLRSSISSCMCFNAAGSPRWRLVYKEKAWEPYHCSFHSLRPSHAHYRWTSKLAEASCRICANTPLADTRVPTVGGIYISTLASTVCFIPDGNWSLRSFNESRKSVK